jgi:hypothetical protein
LKYTLNFTLLNLRKDHRAFNLSLPSVYELIVLPYQEELQMLMLDSGVSLEGELFSSDFKFRHCFNNKKSADNKLSSDGGACEREISEDTHPMVQERLAKLKEKYRKVFQEQALELGLCERDLAIACYLISYSHPENQSSEFYFNSQLEKEGADEDETEAIEEFKIV